MYQHALNPHSVDSKHEKWPIRTKLVEAHCIVNRPYSMHYSSDFNVHILNVTIPQYIQVPIQVQVHETYRPVYHTCICQDYPVYQP